jgi:hypothetical protein
VHSEIFASDKSFILIRIKGFSEKSILNLKINREETPHQEACILLFIKGYVNINMLKT